MEIEATKNVALTVKFAMVDSASPEDYKTGETVADDAYYDDGGGDQALAITDTVSEIGATGMYTLDLDADEMDHDLITIKLTSTNAADNMLVIRTTVNGLDDIAGDVTDILDALLGIAELDYVNDTLTLKRPDTSTLKVFDMTESSDDEKSYTVRTPQ